jgi:hypothetical protein
MKLSVRRSPVLASVLAALLLSACASNPWRVQPGMSQAQLQPLGRPTATYPIQGGTRLQYSQQPLGRKVYNIDLNATGAVVSVSQSLTQKVFESFVPARTTGEDLLREIGPPAERTTVGRFDGTVWTWRFEEQNGRRVFHAFVDRTGLLVQAYSLDEFFNTPDRN